MRRVTVEAPTRSRMAPKLGTDSAMKSRPRTERLRNKHLAQLKSKLEYDIYWLSGNIKLGPAGIPRKLSKN